MGSILALLVFLVSIFTAIGLLSGEKLL